MIVIKPEKNSRKSKKIIVREIAYPQKIVETYEFYNFKTLNEFLKRGQSYVNNRLKSLLTSRDGKTYFIESVEEKPNLSETELELIWLSLEEYHKEKAERDRLNKIKHAEDERYIREAEEALKNQLSHLLQKKIILLKKEKSTAFVDKQIKSAKRAYLLRVIDIKYGNLTEAIDTNEMENFKELLEV